MVVHALIQQGFHVLFTRATFQSAFGCRRADSADDLAAARFTNTPILGMAARRMPRRAERAVAPTE
jgi:hypothetical protein